MHVTATRSGNWWAIEATHHGQPIFTQAKRLDQVESLVRDAFAMMAIDITDESIDVTPIVDGADTAQAARLASRNAAAAAKAASESMRKAAVALKSHGLPVRDVAVMLDISPQRVSQLTTANPRS